jgi:hypothetical protein
MPEWSLLTAKICSAEGNSAQIALGWAALPTIGCCVVLYAMAFVIIGGQRTARVPFAFRIGVHKRQRRSAGKRQPADTGGWNATPSPSKAFRGLGYILLG